MASEAARRRRHTLRIPTLPTQGAHPALAGRSTRRGTATSQPWWRCGTPSLLCRPALRKLKAKTSK
ncbi:Mediator of RNA polymerase II transcription subunit 30 [Zea mays]|uniref:Mediator of RNA polymerase II transcription subunit 30 n=1 Tax=Zea mays TaxID=4577 RepID=A0A1D6ECP1_MAIZE|nr:Mediator of RNA polymerase II transcription subunit 30 [Zea mays]